jgi:hypothetical protein
MKYADEVSVRETPKMNTFPMCHHAPQPWYERVQRVELFRGGSPFLIVDPKSYCNLPTTAYHLSYGLLPNIDGTARQDPQHHLNRVPEPVSLFIEVGASDVDDCVIDSIQNVITIRRLYASTSPGTIS